MASFWALEMSAGTALFALRYQKRYIPRPALSRCLTGTGICTSLWLSLSNTAKSRNIFASCLVLTS